MPENMFSYVCFVPTSHFVACYGQFYNEAAEHMLTLKCKKTKVVEFGNSLDPDEVAHNGLSHLELHLLLSCL